MWLGLLIDTPSNVCRAIDQHSPYVCWAIVCSPQVCTCNCIRSLCGWSTSWSLVFLSAWPCALPKGFQLGSVSLHGACCLCWSFVAKSKGPSLSSTCLTYLHLIQLILLCSCSSFALGFHGSQIFLLVCCWLLLRLLCWLAPKWGVPRMCLVVN